MNRELLACLVWFAFALAAPAFAEEVLPRPEPPFAGKIGLTTQAEFDELQDGKQYTVIN